MGKAMWILILQLFHLSIPRRSKAAQPSVAQLSGRLHSCWGLSESLPVAGQKPQAGGADLVVEDHQLQSLSLAVVYSVACQVEDPPLTVGLGHVVSGQNDGDIHEILFWKAQRQTQVSARVLGWMQVAALRRSLLVSHRPKVNRTNGHTDHAIRNTTSPKVWQCLFFS